MNKESFNQLISNPASVNPKSKAELKSLVKSFPYSSSIRLLYLSALLNDSDVHFEQELKRTAGFMSDRRVLRKLVSSPTPKEEYLVDPPSAPMEVVETVQPSTESKPVEKAQEVEQPVALEIKKETPEPIETNSPTKNIVEEIKVDDQPTEEKAQEDKIELKLLKVPNKSEAAQEENSLEETSSIEEPTVEVPIISTEQEETSQEPKELNEPLIPELEAEIVASAVNASLTMEVDEAREEVRAQIELEEAQKERNPEEKKTFLDWIGAKPVETFSDPKPDPKEVEREEFRKRAESLINQFIINQPKIKVKSEFYSPDDMAKKSLVDESELVTETLAQVYANQGNIPKAIETYEKLILKIPEKKSYFATLIENLKS